jgi:hypothetical protein
MNNPEELQLTDRPAPEGKRHPPAPTKCLNLVSIGGFWFTCGHIFAGVKFLCPDCEAKEEDQDEA